MTACHGLNVTSQLRPPPCQPLMPPGATITPYRDTEEGRGTLPRGGAHQPSGGRHPSIRRKVEVGAAHLFSALNLHVKQHGKKKREKQGSSSVASVKFPSIPALSFPICTVGPMSTPGSPYGREALGSEGQSLPVLEFSAASPPPRTLSGPWSLKSEPAGNREKAGPATWGRHGAPALNPVSGQL